MQSLRLPLDPGCNHFGYPSILGAITSVTPRSWVQSLRLPLDPGCNTGNVRKRYACSAWMQLCVDA
eukprot:290209-Chlamydomonas_euryale.AAC.3